MADKNCKICTVRAPWEDGSGYFLFSYILMEGTMGANSYIVASPTTNPTNNASTVANLINTKLGIDINSYIPMVPPIYNATLYPSWTLTSEETRQNGKMDELFLLGSGPYYDKPFIINEHVYRVHYVNKYAIVERRTAPDTWTDVGVPARQGTVTAVAGLLFPVDNIENPTQAMGNAAYRFSCSNVIPSGEFRAYYRVEISLSSQSQTIFTSGLYADLFNDILTLHPFDIYDPYGPYGPSGDSTNDGTFDNTSDTIDNPYSTVMGTNNGGLVTVYTPTETELNSLKAYLFNTGTASGDILPAIEGVLNQIGQSAGIVNSPTDYILKLYEIPLSVAGSSTRHMNLGFIDTLIDFHYTTSTLKEVDMGSITIDKYYGNALDYQSTIQIYLPYVGYKMLDAKGVMGKTLNIKYLVDLYTANCVAQIYVDGTIMYQFNGNIGYDLPLGQENFGNSLSSGISNGIAMLAKTAA